MAKIQEFIASNYQLVHSMVKSIYEYKATINKVNVLEQRIFILEAQVVDSVIY